MASSFGNTPNPWASSYDTYNDCSQGLCSVYCPQWCYLVLPPPPPFFALDTDSAAVSSSSPDFSPLIIVLIGILASAFILVSYYTLVSKHCRGAPNDSDTNQNDNMAASAATNGNDVENAANSQPNSEGLEEGLIKSMKVYKYRKSDGGGARDCSVCLSEFEENDGLRMLPKCNHAFHVPCIDTWLKSHSTCPLCRSNIASAANDTSFVLAQRVVRSSAEAVVVVVVEDSSELGLGNEEQEQQQQQVLMRPKRPIAVSPYSDRLLVADILLREYDDDDDDDDDDEDLVVGHRHHMENNGMPCWFGNSDNNNIGTSSNHDSSGTALSLMRSPLATSRSISSGTFLFTKYGHDKNSLRHN